MVEIGGYPIIWHIMKNLSQFGINDFIVCLGYKGHVVKEYFLNFENWNNDIRVKFDDSKVKIISKFSSDPWNISLVDTGLETNTALRLKKVERFIENERFLVTYGDGLSDVNINNLVDFHKSHQKIATLTAVQPVSRFGSLKVTKKNRITELAIAIRDSQQSLENVVGEIEFLEKQIGQLRYQIKYAYCLEDGSYIDLETLCKEHDKLRSILNSLGNSYVG
jgi:glucose-1-phosphate cytidylyltransferase